MRFILALIFSVGLWAGDAVEMPKKTEDPNEWVRVMVSNGLPGTATAQGDAFSTCHGVVMYGQWDNYYKTVTRVSMQVKYAPRWLAKYPRSSAAKDALTPEQRAIVDKMDAEAAVWMPLAREYYSKVKAVTGACVAYENEWDRQVKAGEKARKTNDTTFNTEERRNSRETRLKGLADRRTAASEAMGQFNSGPDGVAMEQALSELRKLWGPWLQDTKPREVK